MNGRANGLHGTHWRWLACAMVAASTLGCGSDSDGGGSGGPAYTDTTVAGTVTLPSDASGTCAMVAVDDDTSGSNASARRPDGSYLLSYHHVSGQTLSFSFDSVPTGSYFIWAYVDADMSASDPSGNCEVSGAPTSGDHFGYYDTGVREPTAPNVTVPHADGQTFDFALGMVP